MMLLIISTCEHKLHEYEFVKPITDIFPEGRVVHYKELVDEYKNADALIITGTSLKDEEYLKRLNKFEWLRTYEKPVIGICAGAQIIAKQNWASITYGKEIGMIKIKGKPPFPEIFEGYALHKNAILESSDFEVLAKNERMQAFRKGKKYGILFHPEVRNKEVLKNIFLKEGINL